jgi:hypothetical protein
VVSATGPHGRKVLFSRPENNTKLIRKLPAKGEKDCCVCSKRTKNGPLKRRRSRIVCVKCEKGLHGECFQQQKCSK